MSFDYDMIMRVAQRLENDGYPQFAVKRLRDWANKRRLELEVKYANTQATR